jgi:hypothetical protein
VLGVLRYLSCMSDIQSPFFSPLLSFSNAVTASSSGYAYCNLPMRLNPLAQESLPLLGRRKRTSKPKVKSGCFTCKARHLKCDEGKPTCHRCRKDDWDCGGYKEEKRPPKPHLLAPKRTINRLRTKPGECACLLCEL